jgi:hypothetical protein
MVICKECGETFEENEVFEDGEGNYICHNCLRIVEASKMVLEELKPHVAYKAPQENVSPVMREFDTGATRDTDESKLDYEGFLSPIVLQRYAEYLHKHRVQSDGRARDSDNWQKGIPLDVYMKSNCRHFIDAWKWHRGFVGRDSLEEALCAILFNTQGYLYELLKDKLSNQED